MNEKISGGLRAPDALLVVSGNGLSGKEWITICRRDRDRDLYRIEAEKRREARDRRSGKRGFGKDWGND